MNARPPSPAPAYVQDRPPLRPPTHRISIVCGGKEIVDWKSYSIQVSMLEPSGTFSVTLAWSLEAWQMVRLDSKVRVTIDAVVVMDGYIEKRRRSAKSGTIEVSGRDKVGRMVQESAPSVNFSGLTMDKLIEKLAIAPHLFEAVVFSNVRNRRVLRGKGHKVRDSGTVFLKTKKHVGTRIEPGQPRYAAIQTLLQQTGYVAWSSGDGRELFVGEPDYGQGIQFRFVHVAAGSSRSSNIEELEVEDSCGDRFARCLYLGSGVGTDDNYGVGPATRYGEAKDNPETRDGTGRDFQYPKTLIVADHRSLASRAEGKELAAQTMAKRDVGGHVLRVTAPLHGQLVAGTEVTLFCFDTLAYVEDEEDPSNTGAYLVTGCSYEAEREGGERTTLDLVPKGTRIVP